jgi:hypothetical protein
VRASKERTRKVKPATPVARPTVRKPFTSLSQVISDDSDSDVETVEAAVPVKEPSPYVIGPTGCPVLMIVPTSMLLVLATFPKVMVVRMVQRQIPTHPCMSISVHFEAILVSVYAAQPPGRHWPLRSPRPRRNWMTNLSCMSPPLMLYHGFISAIALSRPTLPASQRLKANQQ